MKEFEGLFGRIEFPKMNPTYLWSFWWKKIETSMVEFLQGSSSFNNGVWGRKVSWERILMWELNNERMNWIKWIKWIKGLYSLGNQLKNNSQKHIKNTRNYEIAPGDWLWPIGQNQTNQICGQGCTSRLGRAPFCFSPILASVGKFRFSFGTS